MDNKRIILQQIEETLREVQEVALRENVALDIMVSVYAFDIGEPSQPRVLNAYIPGVPGSPAQKFFAEQHIGGFIEAYENIYGEEYGDED